MVVQLGDTCIIPDPEKYMSDRRTVEWSQDWGRQKSVDFCFIPFTCPRDNTGAFLAVEIDRMEEFKQSCRESPSDPEDWTCNETTYQFTVDNRFKYGQNNEQTWRFLVFQDPDYEPYQHRFSEAANSTEAMTFLGNLGKNWSQYVEIAPNGDDIASLLKCVVGDDLRSF